MELPRIFIGTMRSGEGGWEAHQAAIDSQQEIAMTRFIVDGLGEREAHRALYAEWNRVKHEHDAFVQVDPDTVINSSITLSLVYDSLVSWVQNGYTSVQFGLHDYMTDSTIMGLNMYSPAVIFSEPGELWCDRCTSNNRTHVTKTLAGRHAYDATPIQAFRFGVHRGLKRGLGADYQKVKQAYLAQEPDARPWSPRQLALHGFHVADELRKDFDYTGTLLAARLERDLGRIPDLVDRSVRA